MIDSRRRRATAQPYNPKSGFTLPFWLFIHLARGRRRFFPPFIHKEAIE